MTYLYLRQSMRLECLKRFSNVEQSPGGGYCGSQDENDCRDGRCAESDFYRNLNCDDGDCC